MSPDPRLLRVTEAAFRATLRLHPRRFRERFGQDAVRAFRDGARGALRRRGRRGLLAFSLGCLVDGAVEAAAARWEALRSARAAGRGGAPGDGGRAGAGDPDSGGSGGGFPGGGRPGGAARLDGLVSDATGAWRALRRRPATAAVAALTLALAVGATASVFAVVNGVLLRPLALPDAHELVVLQDRSLDGGAPFRTTGGAFLEWRDDNRTLDDVALMGGWTMNLTEPGLEPERVEGSNVSASFFSVLGVEPALGRAFRSEEMRGGPRVVILSDALWRARYGADPDIVGRTLTADGEAWRVVGVMPPVALPTPVGDVTLDPPDARRVWVPLDFDQEWVAGYRSHVFVAVGRLREGVSPEAAAADVEALTEGIRQRRPEGYARLASDVRPLRDVVLGDVRRDLWVLLGAVTLVLLVACANLANLLLARSVDAGRERAVRSALGAGGGRLLRLGLIEAAFLGLAGGALGVVAATVGVDVLTAVLPGDLPRRADIGLDAVVVAFAAAASLVAALAAGLPPALRGARPALASALGSGVRTSAGRRAGRLTRGLVASQLALACALLVGAGLLVRSVQALTATDLGADTGSTLDAGILLPAARYDTREAAAEALRRLEESVDAVPGVTSAAIGYDTPVSASWTETFEVVDRPPPPAGERPGAWFRPVSPGYFAQHGIRLLAGRGFDAADDLDAPGVVVVNETFAREHFPGEEALGRRVRMETVRGTWGGDAPVEWEVVGVVEDVRFLGARRPPPDAFYFSLRQAPVGFVRLMARTAGDPRSALPAVREAVGAVDPALPLAGVTTLDEERARLTAQDRLNALLLATFAAVALAVAGAGVYAVLSHAVARRVPEMGVRLALGARPASVERLLLAESARMAGVGLALGAAGALAVGRLLAGMLYGVRPWDPVVLAGVVAVLLATALAAGWLPARRASATDPAVALRAE